MECVGFDHPFADNYFKADGQDSNGFPYYKSLCTSRFLYFHPADSSWYISGTLGDSAHGLDVKSNDGAIPTGSRSWDVAINGTWTSRTFKATEMVWQSRHVEKALRASLRAERGWLSCVCLCSTIVAGKRATSATCQYGVILRESRRKL